MAERNPPTWVQGGAHPAEHDRLTLAAVLGIPTTFSTFPGGMSRDNVRGGHGVFGAADMEVIQAAAPNMNVRIRSGSAVVRGSTAFDQGCYLVHNDATRNITLAASDPTHPRDDIIIARIRDNEAIPGIGSPDTWTLEAVTGTPGAVPVDPALPADCLPLARVRVAALDTTITTADITDLRYRAWAVGGTGYMTSAQRAAMVGMIAGDRIQESDTGRVYYYTGSAWQLTSAGKVPYARVSRVASLNVADSTNVVVPFDTEASDVLGMHASGVFTIPATMAGAWDLASSLVWDSNTTGRRYLTYTVNGVQGETIGYQGSGDPGPITAGVANLILAAGDLVRVVAFQVSSPSGTRTVTGTATMTFRGAA
jgi:hypothetical protein